LIGDKIERPAVVRSVWDQHRCPCAESPLAPAPPPADQEVSLAINPKSAPLSLRQVRPARLESPPGLTASHASARPEQISQIDLTRPPKLHPYTVWFRYGLYRQVY
jgi:hypothetical protein